MFAQKSVQKCLQQFCSKTLKKKNWKPKCPLISDNRKLLSNKKEQAFTICHNLDEAQRVKEPSLEVYILHDSIYMTSSRR